MPDQALSTPAASPRTVPSTNAVPRPAQRAASGPNSPCPLPSESESVLEKPESDSRSLAGADHGERVAPGCDRTMPSTRDHHHEAPAGPGLPLQQHTMTATLKRTARQAAAVCLFTTRLAGWLTTREPSWRSSSASPSSTPGRDRRAARYRADTIRPRRRLHAALRAGPALDQHGPDSDRRPTARAGHRANRKRFPLPQPPGLHKYNPAPVHRPTGRTPIDALRTAQDAGTGKVPTKALSPRFRARETYRRDKTATAEKAGQPRPDAFAGARTTGKRYRRDAETGLSAKF